MGTSRSFAELASKMDKAGVEVKGASDLAVRELAKDTKRTVVGLMSRATGGDLVMSGFGRNAKKPQGAGKKIGVSYKIEQRNGATQAFVKATGPAHLVESDVAPHVVVSRYAQTAAKVSYTSKKGKVISSRRGRAAFAAAAAQGVGFTGGRRAVLGYGDGRFRRSTIAKSKGRHPWEMGINAMRPQVARQIAKSNAKAIGRVFR